MDVRLFLLMIHTTSLQHVDIKTQGHTILLLPLKLFIEKSETLKVVRVIAFIFVAFVRQLRKCFEQN